MKKVILTKPGNASKKIANSLVQAGLSKDNLLVWPAFSFRKPDLPDTETVRREVELGAVVVVVSPTAAEFLYEELPDLPSDTQFAAVGEPTAKKISKLYQPSKPVLYPPGTVDVSGSERLFELFVSKGLPKRVVIARGQTGRECLYDSLSEKGVIVRKAVIYERIPFEISVSERSRVHPQDELIILVTSTDAVNHLWNGLGKDFDASLKRACYFTIHQRIADRLKALGAQNITIYDSTRDDLVRLIKEELGS